jgi:hypothetical protein
MKKYSGTVTFVRRLLKQVDIAVYSRPGLEKHDLKALAMGRRPPLGPGSGCL